eukprot:scaffold2144_cov215-Pinguiococcus_pyrenoidosus.AAC.16
MECVSDASQPNKGFSVAEPSLFHPMRRRTLTAGREKLDPRRFACFRLRDALPMPSSQPSALWRNRRLRRLCE